MRSGRQIFVILVLSICIAASSKNAHNYHDAHLTHATPWPPATPTTIQQEFQVAGGGSPTPPPRASAGPLKNTRIPEIEEKTPEIEEQQINPGTRPKPEAGESAGGGVVIRSANIRPRINVPVVTTPDAITASTINKVAAFIGDDGVFVDDMLSGIGFRAAAHAEWKALPVVSKLEFAFRAAEKANPGSGTQVLANAAHVLRTKYESVGHDPALRELLAIPPKQRMEFAEMEVFSPQLARDRFRQGRGERGIEVDSPSNAPLPTEIRQIIGAIVRYCDPCAPLGGMRDILEHRLGASGWYDILRSSRSNEEAFARAYEGLERVDADARVKRMVEILQDTYEGARKDAVFNAFMERPALELRPSVPGVADYQ